MEATMSDKTDGVLAALNLNLRLCGQFRNEAAKKAYNAVAELLAADEEYDAAFSAEYPKQTIIARRPAAIDRRAAAIRAMRGES